jgi:hypothetical protein
MRLQSLVCVVSRLFRFARSATSTVPVDVSATADADSFAAKYEQQQRERFDLLRSDSSPRVQALAGRIYLDSNDPATQLLSHPFCV